ncbi:MAG: cellulose biosynthesis cyclic di-GMP-binding regulatory protein BcsB, partial [Dehalococcoidia bacterium]|nr:cellulose biosynthesis cyclic di-GMP-binding regulatory protein BcsB [Dehalococcoidia bacterium]
TVVLNNTPIGSVTLRPIHANRGSVRIAIPPSVLAPGQNTLQFNFGFQQDRTVCQEPLRENVWGVIHSDTEIRLPLSPETTTLGLQYYAYPFVRGGSLANSLLALPDQPTARDLSVAAQLAIDLGRRASMDALWLQAAPASAVTDAQKRERNVILIGRLEDNRLIREINEALPLAVGEETRSLRQANQTVVTVRGQGDVGIVQQVVSPWTVSENDRAVVMVVTGTTAESVGWAARALTTNRLSGTVVTVTRDNRVSVVVGSPTTPPTGLAALQQGRQQIPVLAGLAVAAMIAGLFVLLVVQLWLQRRRKNAAGN